MVVCVFQILCASSFFALIPSDVDDDENVGLINSQSFIFRIPAATAAEPLGHKLVRVASYRVGSSVDGRTFRL